MGHSVRYFDKMSGILTLRPSRHRRILTRNTKRIRLSGRETHGEQRDEERKDSRDLKGFRSLNMKHRNDWFRYKPNIFHELFTIN